MIKENFDPQAIYKMWGTLTVEGWVANEKLPKGWRVRSKDRLKDNWQFYFLSPQMEIFKSNKAVLDYITAQSETYTQEDYEKVKIYIEEEQRERRSGNYTWHDSKSLPDGNYFIYFRFRYFYFPYLRLEDEEGGDKLKQCERILLDA